MRIKVLAAAAMATVLLLPCLGYAQRLAASSRSTSTTTSSMPASTAIAQDILSWTEPAIGEIESQMAIARCLSFVPLSGPKQAADALGRGVELVDRFERKLDQQMRTATAPAAGAQPVTPEVLKAMESIEQVRRCQAELLRGQLYLYSAMSMAGDDSKRADNLAKASEVFRTLRVDYRHLPLGLMGYLFDSQAQRARGDIKAAYEAIAPVLNMEIQPSDKVGAELRRLATLERLETRMIESPAQALKEATAWKASAELKNEPAWRKRIDWLLAKAMLSEIASAAARGPVPAEKISLCAQALRSDAAIAAAEPFERSAALARLDNLGGRTVMNGQELLEWARFLAAIGLPGAAEAFARAQAAGNELPPDAMIEYASALWKQGDFLPAAQQCDTILAKLPVDDGRKGGVLQLRASSLLRDWQSSQNIDAKAKSRLAAALEAVFESPLPDNVRRDALHQWVYAASQPSGRILSTLEQQPSLVEKDAFLLFSRAESRLKIATAPATRWASGSSIASPSKAELDRIIKDLSAGELAAAQAKDAALCGSIVLLHAKVLSGAAVGDSRGALQLLTDKQQLLEGSGPHALAARWMRVQLLLDLGMVEAAGKELVLLPEQGQSPHSTVPVLLAEALAARYPSADPATAGSIRQQVLSLCNRAMSQALSDASQYLSTSRRCARCLVEVRAEADAIKIIEDMLRQKEVQADKNVLLEVSLLQVSTMRQQSRLTEAMAKLDELAKASPKSAAVALARGRCQLELRQWDAAAESFRQVRRVAASGSVDWCQGTLELAQTLASQGQTAAANDIIRVAGAMHPDFGNVELKAKLSRMIDQLKDSSTTRAGTSTK